MTDEPQPVIKQAIDDQIATGIPDPEQIIKQIQANETPSMPKRYARIVPAPQPAEPIHAAFGDLATPTGQATMNKAAAALGQLMDRLPKDLGLVTGHIDPEPTPVAESIITAQDAVNHPEHYMSHPSGIECIEVTEHAGFNIGNAIKYLWRTEWGSKGDPADNLRKAIWYLERELAKIESSA